MSAATPATAVARARRQLDMLVPVLLRSDDAELSWAAARLGQELESLEHAGAEPTASPVGGPRRGEWIEAGVAALGPALAGDPAARDELAVALEQLESAADSRSMGADLEPSWDADLPPDAPESDSDVEPDLESADGPVCEQAAAPADLGADLQRILAAIGHAAPSANRVPPSQPASSPPASSPPAAPLSPDAPAWHLDPGLREAFLDDAGQCLAGMEAAALAFEAHPGQSSCLRQICRELHTLKGASGSVGLRSLVERLHAAEEWLQGHLDQGQAPAAPQLLARMDEIRSLVEQACSGAGCGVRGEEQASGAVAGTEATASLAAASPPARPATNELSEAPPQASLEQGAESTQRVRTSQLDRLMDMLAELVMLRNRRGARADELQQLAVDLGDMVAQLRNLAVTLRSGADAATGRASAQAVAELASDLAETQRRLRDATAPLRDDNEQVGQFIGGFRQELAALRRAPVAGLFGRLRRVARDAARAEAKQVRLEMAGELTGVEGSLQERLYEPLLHIVRNAVSHGVESPETRVGAGKRAEGTIVCEARGGGNLLQIEVRDDGRGLDYDAIRRRGVERGLLTPDRPASPQELAQLIFHPGFSTRESAGEVAGRGVGMDVVAATVRKLRGWIDIDSRPGHGTTIRLTLPLPSVIEHAMLVRAGGALFGLPMSLLHELHDGPAALGDRSRRTPHLAEMLGLPSSPSSASHRLRLTGRVEDDRESALLVDEVVGAEEVVVRPLPALLKHHPWYSGMTLAGDGDIVLLLEPRAVARFVTSAAAESLRPDNEPARPAGAIAVSPTAPAHPTPLVGRALVADDSRTARGRVVRCLREHGWNVDEAADGAEALERVRRDTYDLLVTDIEMPRRTGIELLQELRAAGAQLPAIVVSSRDEPETRQRTAQLGAVAHLAKPVDEVTLADLLRRLASHQSPATSHLPGSSR